MSQLNAYIECNLSHAQGDLSHQSPSKPSNTGLREHSKKIYKNKFKKGS